MDAAALLKSQGWRGKGFSLHPTDERIGLAKPLLLSRNKDNRGIGQKPHYTSDQWWLDAFDQKLKGLDTSSGKGIVQSVTKGKLDAVVQCAGNGKYAGLYTSFVRGETLLGTLSSLEGTATPETAGEEERKTKEERRARRAAKRLRKEEKAKRESAKKLAKGGETKEERRARRAERRKRKEERRERREKKAGGG
jgi:nucleolar protein TMA23